MTTLRLIKSLEQSRIKRNKKNLDLFMSLILWSILTVMMALPFYFLGDELNPFLVALFGVCLMLWMVCWLIVFQLHSIYCMFQELKSSILWWCSFFKRAYKKWGIRWAILAVFRHRYKISKKPTAKSVKMVNEPHPTKLKPENTFYEILDSWENPLNNNGNPKQELVDALTIKQKINGKKRRLYCYTVKDSNKENPVPLTEPTARRLIIEHFTHKKRKKPKKSWKAHFQKFIRKNKKRRFWLTNN